MAVKKNTSEFEYTTEAGEVISLPPLTPTFGDLRKIRKLSDFDQFSTLVEKFVTDDGALDALDLIPSSEVPKLRDAWFKHSQGTTLGESSPS